MTGVWPSVALPSRIPSSTRRQPGPLGLQHQLLRLHQVRLQLQQGRRLAHQGGPRAQTCQVSAFAWSEFISPPTESFMLWVDAPPTSQAAISLIRLNMIPAATAGLPKGLLIRTTRSTTWHAVC